jgi:predicted NodU family carbamoyl transferase
VGDFIRRFFVELHGNSCSPINTPANAYSTFAKSEMDTLVLGDFLVDKPKG